MARLVTIARPAIADTVGAEIVALVEVEIVRIAGNAQRQVAHRMKIAARSAATGVAAATGSVAAVPEDMEEAVVAVEPLEAVDSRQRSSSIAHHRTSPHRKASSRAGSIPPAMADSCARR